MYAAWQDWLVIGIVAVAGIYLVRRLFLPKRKPGAACCSGCENCPAVGTRLIPLGLSGDALGGRSHSSGDERECETSDVTPAS